MNIIAPGVYKICFGRSNLILIDVISTSETQLDFPFMNEIDLPAATVNIRPDGIMHIHIKVESNFEIEHSKQVVEARTRVCNDKPYPILYTAANLVIPTEEVMEYVASEDRSKLVIADAFVVNSLPQRLAARFYRLLNKPVRPTRYFDNKKDAINWLKQHVVE